MVTLTTGILFVLVFAPFVLWFIIGLRSCLGSKFRIKELVMNKRILLASWGFCFGMLGAVIVRSYLAGTMSASDRELAGWCTFGFCLLALLTLKLEGE